jgi:hypothetical protein
MLYQFRIHFNICETPFTYGLYTVQRLFLFIRPTATLGINNQVSESLGITVELKIMSQANFIKHLVVLGIWWKLYCEDSELNLFPHVVDG